MFLAGDAAHLMPPFLGQGLCSGMRDAKALSWRPAAISRDGASPALLDSYGSERTAHVQEIIRQAVEMGRIICMLDPVEVAERDDRMKAAIRNPALALQPPPEPRLGDGGAFRAGDPHAGCLAVQGRVRRDGREGLLDDIAGAGWQLLLRDAEGESALDGGARETARRLGVVVADFGAQGDLEDVDGSYAVWFDRLGAEVVLVRPDFHIFGTGAWADAGALLVSAQALLETGAAPIAA